MNAYLVRISLLLLVLIRFLLSFFGLPIDFGQTVFSVVTHAPEISQENVSEFVMYCTGDIAEGVIDDDVGHIIGAGGPH